MGNHYNCSDCGQYYAACQCQVETKVRKTVGSELKEASDKLEEHTKREESAVYWLSIRAEGQKLCAQAVEECRKAVLTRKRSLGFGEIRDENLAKKLVELLEEEELQVALKYNEGNTSAYLHDDRASYYWVEISW